MAETMTVHLPSQDKDKPGLFGKVAAEQVGLQYINMVALRLAKASTFEIQIHDYEYVAVILSGVCNIKTSRGEFTNVGRRPTVFSGMPYAVYMPRQTDFEIEALSESLEIMSCWVPTDRDHPLRLITPEDVKLSVQGGERATWQSNTIIGPEFDAYRLLVTETYVPGGNWAYYPPAAYDPREMLSFYKMDRPGGYALRHVYTDDGEIDEVMQIKQHDIGLLPKGYHTLVSAPGTTTYSLNVLAGTSRKLESADDPDYAWVRETWTGKDVRLPVVDHGMEPRKK